jgi:hypothetical protein
MPSDRLSDAGVRNLEPRSNTFIVFDSAVKGFGIRVTPAGAKSFVIDYRNASGRQRRYTIGKFPTWGVTAARSEAKKQLQKVGTGSDPVADRKKYQGGNMRGAEEAWPLWRGFFCFANRPQQSQQFRHVHNNAPRLIERQHLSHVSFSSCLASVDVA